MGKWVLDERKMSFQAERNCYIENDRYYYELLKKFLVIDKYEYWKSCYAMRKLLEIMGNWFLTQENCL